MLGIVKKNGTKLLNRPQFRPVLALLGSIYISVTRQVCRVSYRDDKWIHKYRDGTIVRPKIGGAIPSKNVEKTKDYWLFNYVPEAGDIVVDVGAGIGDEMHVFSNMVGYGGKVVCIEANLTTFHCMQLSCLLNDLKNVIPLNVAVCDKTGELLITDDNENRLANTIINRDNTINKQYIVGDTLDNILESLKIKRIDLLKMNIEGAEVPALNGARKTLECTANVAISCHDFIADRNGQSMFRTKTRVCQLLESHGFELTFRKTDKREYVRDIVYGRH